MGTLPRTTPAPPVGYLKRQCEAAFNLWDTLNPDEREALQLGNLGRARTLTATDGSAVEAELLLWPLAVRNVPGADILLACLYQQGSLWRYACDWWSVAAHRGVPGTAYCADLIHQSMREIESYFSCTEGDGFTLDGAHENAERTEDSLRSLVLMRTLARDAVAYPAEDPADLTLLYSYLNSCTPEVRAEIAELAARMEGL